MADITTADVTYAILPYPKGSILEDHPPRYSNLVAVSFGNGVLTYPTNGIPLIGTGLGMPQSQVEIVQVIDQLQSLVDNNIEWFWDSTNNTLRAFTPNLSEVTPGTAVFPNTIIVLARGY